MSYYSFIFSYNTALIYSPLESLIGQVRGTQDVTNSIAAAGITGALFKSTGKVLALLCTVVDVFVFVQLGQGL